MAGRHIRYNVAGSYFEYSTTGLEAGPWTRLPILINDARVAYEDEANVFSVAANQFTDRIQFNGGSASFPALRRNAATLESILADQSGYAGFASSYVNLIGGHLAFPATQNPSADPNVLDDYEEGLWTPVLSAASGSGVTYSSRGGIYTKKGREVSIGGRITISSKGTLAGALAITGLPFTSVNEGNYGYVPINITHFANLVTNVSWFGGLIFANTTFFDLRHILAAGGTGVGSLTAADIGGTFDFIFAGVMQV